MSSKSKKKGTDPVGAALVIGGGIAGIQASLDLAESGQKVYLLETGPAIGGNMPRLDKTFPTNDCSMCILSPKIVECGRHLNIEAITWSQLEGLSGSPGNFKARIRRRARYVDVEKCTGCGDCEEVCPVSVPSEFDALLRDRKAIFRPYPQAYPNAFVIDKQFFPACRHACPAGVNVHGFVALMAEGKFDEALESYRTDNPFPASCGRICDHPCQDGCNRGKLDDPLAIRNLHRFLADREIQAAETGTPPALTDEIRERRKKRFSPRGEGQKVAIVGSGPAGLTCAWDLANMGYKPVVFERLGVAGGMLRVGVPEYRLPVAVLDYEIEVIKQAGAELELGKAVDADFTFSDLRKQGCEAIFVATGLHKSRKLGVEGEDLEGVLCGSDFLLDARTSDSARITGKVMVIGGGNVAIDVARTAVRLGADEVHVACLESPVEMFASEEEIEGALEEGVEIHNKVSPKRFLAENGHVSGIEFLECLSVFDDEGRFAPTVRRGSEHTMSADRVVVAIGQGADEELLKAVDGTMSTRRGLLAVDETLATSVKGVFAGGDAVLGADVAVGAVGTGHKAALSIDRFLNGEDLRRDRDDIAPPVPADDLAPVPKGPHPYAACAQMAVVPPADRIKGFAEVETGYTETQAVQEAKRCLHCTTCSECLQCVEACKAEAICHDEKDRIEEIDVGAVVVVPGFDEFSAGLEYDFGYSRYDDVITSFQFERVLSASGPFMGHVQRISDGEEPKRIAFLQCVGSRDVSCRNQYCSSVCCMYTIKEAVIAKEHMKNVDVTVFFMDMRAFGKDFDKYYERAKAEYGVNFVRARVGNVEKKDGNSGLTVRYTGDNGDAAEQEFDMVVLSAGFEPPAKARDLAERLGLKREENGFFWTDPVDPLRTSRDGVFVGGAASGPKDIPETVTQASGAAGKASQLLAGARDTLTTEPEYPPERDVVGQDPRIGVFVCHCGINIGGVVDVPALTEYAKTLQDVAYAENNLYTCSQDTQGHMREMILEHNLNRVIVTSCSPRTHEPLFRNTLREAGLNAYLFEMANIRDQCSWVHMREPEKATEKAKGLLRMAVAKARTLDCLYSKPLPIRSGALVVGGGLAGMTSALSLAEQGFPVTLAERSGKLGGNLEHLHYLLDDQDPGMILQGTVERVEAHPNITVLTKANVAAIDGFVGNFTSRIEQGGKETEIEHGAVIVATGASEHTPTEYLYGQNDMVLTQRELERALAKPSFGRQPAIGDLRSVVMIQCVGSREEDHMYCSRVCCSAAVKNALKIKELSPETEVYVLYRDMRTYGFSEAYYQAAREKGVLFVRYDVDRKPEVTDEGGLAVTVAEPLLGRELVLRPDLLVLSSRIDANADSKELAQMLKVPLNEDGFFLEAHMKLRPVDFATDGVFLAGMAHAPKNISETIAQAEAAASRAATVISKEEMALEPIISEVIDANCDGCAYCIDPCPYNALTLLEYMRNGAIKKTVERNEALCKGCGVCMATCPKLGIFVRNFRIEQLNAMVEAALEVE